MLVEVVQNFVRREIESGQGLHDGAQLAHDRGRRLEWPITSPMTSATLLPGSGIASYQSPPTCAVRQAAR
ncbi:hypothetical protein HNR57_007484 [Streptomyces paradoxus]|uniref:Uncharacterized protein n=1 Tax=Streptomyces paradoxus TaxID=66375 RepID=A0A7W9TIT7_9ACTN|nr:hypothetical protein [Streptomyces paradoxus]